MGTKKLEDKIDVPVETIETGQQHNNNEHYIIYSFNMLEQYKTNICL